MNSFSGKELSSLMVIIVVITGYKAATNFKKFFETKME